jgi:tRNA-modifying protein YgfZ
MRGSNDAVGLDGVEGFRSFPGGGEHGHPICRKLADQRVKRPLDPAHPRGKVVRDQQRPRDLHGRLSSQTVDADRLEDQVDALDERRAFVDGARLRAVEVTGSDAGRWLNDLVTASVEDIPPGGTARSLLLTPTGRVRADFHIVRTDGAFVLVQEPDQPAAIDDLLRPYVLSSDVAVQRAAGTHIVLVPSDRGWAVTRAAGDGAVEASPEAGEVWRIRRGVPRFPSDLDEESLPAEAGLEYLIDFTKGCFLGQEAVAKVRNLGHPPRVVLALRAGVPVRSGEPVVADGRDVGAVSSVAPLRDGFALLARVRWDARTRPLTTASGAQLMPV